MFLDDKDDGYIPLKYKSKKDEEEEKNTIEKKRKKKKITEKQMKKMEAKNPMFACFGKDYLRYLNNN